MKKMLSLVLALCMVMSIGLASAEVTLTIMHEHTESNAEVVASSRMFLKAQEEFLAANPDVKLETTAFGTGNELWDKLAVLAASNDLPDVIYLQSNLFNTFAPEGMLADLTGLVDDVNVYRDKLTVYSYDGKPMALPVKATTYNYVFYNPEIWAEAGYETIPTTWAEFIEACNKIRDMGITPVVYGNKTQWNIISNMFCGIVDEVCGDEWIAGIQAGDGSAKWTDACFIEALNLLQQISTTFNYDFNTVDDQWAVGEFAKGKAAAHISGSWVPGSIKSYEADYPGISTKVRTARIPTVSGGDPTISFAMAQALAVSGKLEGEKLEAAKEFVKYLAGPSYSTHMAGIGEMGPVIVDVDLSSLLPMQQDMFNIMNTYENRIQFTTYVTPAESTELQAAVSSFLSGAISVEEAAQAVQAVAPAK